MQKLMEIDHTPEHKNENNKAYNVSIEKYLFYLDGVKGFLSQKVKTIKEKRYTIRLKISHQNTNLRK